MTTFLRYVVTLVALLMTGFIVDLLGESFGGGLWAVIAACVLVAFGLFMIMVAALMWLDEWCKGDPEGVEENEELS